MRAESKFKLYKKKKFPLWMLLAIICCILGIGLFFNYRLKNLNKLQNFGFHFY